MKTAPSGTFKDLPLVLWIPAFAGMTEGSIHSVRCLLYGPTLGLFPIFPFEPQVDGRLDPFGPEGQLDLSACPCGLVAGVERLLDDSAVFAGGPRLFFAAYAPGEVSHLLWKAVVP